MHRQGQGPSALRVWRQGLACHGAPSLEGRTVHRPRQGDAGQPLRRPHPCDRDPGDRDADRREPLAHRRRPRLSRPAAASARSRVQGLSLAKDAASPRRSNANSPPLGDRTGHRTRQGRASHGSSYLAGSNGDACAPSSPQPAATSAGSSNGWPQHGAPSSWPSSPPLATIRSPRKTALEVHQNAPPLQTPRSSRATAEGVLRRDGGRSRLSDQARVRRVRLRLCADRPQSAGLSVGRRAPVRRELRFPRAPGALAPYRAHSGGEALSRPLSVGVGIWIGRALKERARQVHDVAEGARQSVGEPLLNRGRRRGCDGGRIADALRGRGRALRFVRRTPLSLSNWCC